MWMKCPYCNQEDFVPQEVYAASRLYSCCVLKFNCAKCGKVVKAFIKQEPIVVSVDQTHERSDF